MAVLTTLLAVAPGLTATGSAAAQVSAAPSAPPTSPELTPMVVEDGACLPAGTTRPTGQLAYNAEEFSQLAVSFRAVNNGLMSIDANVVIVEVCQQGKRTLVAVPNDPHKAHSERRIRSALAAKGLTGATVEHIYSELKPCPKCGPYVENEFPEVPVSWSFADNQGANRLFRQRAIASAVTAELRQHSKVLLEAGSAARAVYLEARKQRFVVGRPLGVSQDAVLVQYQDSDGVLKSTLLTGSGNGSALNLAQAEIAKSGTIAGIPKAQIQQLIAGRLPETGTGVTRLSKRFMNSWHPGATRGPALPAGATDKMLVGLAIAFVSRTPKAMVALNRTLQDEWAREQQAERLFTEPAAQTSTGQAASGSAAQAAPAAQAGSGALVRALGAPVNASPGGIDFSSLELRYLSDAPLGHGSSLSYSFAGRALKLGGKTSVSAGVSAARLQSDAFFVWLSLPTSSFTVNLNPNEPDRIVDSALGATDAGRILLEADLQMKKLGARLINPKTTLGAGYWRRLEAAAGRGQVCSASRMWIVPARATIYQDGDQLYIVSAPLRVELESDYTQSATLGCHGSKKEATMAKKLERTIVLPRVQKAVSTAPEFEQLRQVYLSRVAAEWYRTRAERDHMTYGSLIDSGNARSWPSRGHQSPAQVYRQYVTSFNKGEFKVTTHTRRGHYIYTTTYIAGGVDFSSVPAQMLSAADFRVAAPGLGNAVKTSLDQQVSDHSRRQIWLGAGNVVPVAERYNANGSSSSGDAVGPVKPRGPSVWSAGSLAVIAIFLAFVVGTVRSGWRIRSRSGRR